MEDAQDTTSQAIDVVYTKAVPYRRNDIDGTEILMDRWILQ